MATKKEQLTRMQQKHDIEANWLKAINFIPMIGEFIVYDPDEVYDYARFKCGDGVTYVNDLPFIIDTDKTLSLEGKPADAKATGEAINSIKSTINDLHTTSAEIWLVDALSSPIQRTNLLEMTESQGGILNIDVVDILPEILKQSDMQNGDIYVYIVKSTGIGYGDTGNGVTTVGDILIGGGTLFDKGWTDDVNAETETGIYCIPVIGDFAEKKDITWENLPDKPFGEVEKNLGDTVTWDGSIDESNDIVTNEILLDPGTIRYIKVANSVPTIDDIGSNPILKFIGDDGNEQVAETIDIYEDNGIILIGSLFPFVIIVPNDNCEYETIVFPEKGVYFMQGFDADGNAITRCTSLTISNYNFVNTTLKKIDEKYLPESDGLSIKKITFTDRPTAQNWFIENSTKVLNTVFETIMLDAPMSFTNIAMTHEYDTPSVEFILFSLEQVEGNLTILVSSFRISTDGFTYRYGSLGNVPESETIPDDSWGEISLKVTAYYIAEGGNDSGGGESGDDTGGGESGGEEDDSPSCMIIVTNNSTDPIELNAKQLIENNEVVDFTETALGLESAFFYDIPKGSVVTLKTTVPCIVRDGYNNDIVYDNSEYVEVDETNQITYITIPEDSSSIEIVIGERDI